jgi:hypothetical protein
MVGPDYPGPTRQPLSTIWRLDWETAVVVAKSSSRLLYRAHPRASTITEGGSSTFNPDDLHFADRELFGPDKTLLWSTSLRW